MTAEKAYVLLTYQLIAYCEAFPFILKLFSLHFDIEEFGEHPTFRSWAHWGV